MSANETYRRSDDRRHGDRHGADRQWRRHGFRPARRADVSVLRRAPAAKRSHPHDRRAPRTGLRLYGVRLRPLDRPTGRLLRRAGSRRFERRRGFMHGARLQRAGSLRHRPGADALSRPRARPSARIARSARDFAGLDQMGGANRTGGRRAWRDRRSVPPNALGPPWSCRRRNGVGRDGGVRVRDAAAGREDRTAAAAVAAGDRGRRPHSLRGAPADDHGRRRRATRRRGRSGAGGGTRRAGRRVPQRARNRRRRPSARPVFLRRFQALA